MLHERLFESFSTPFYVRTDITTTKLTQPTIANDIAEIAGTTIDAALVTAGVRLLCNKPRKVVVRITNTQAATHVVTVARSTAAQDPPAADYASTAIPATTGVRIFTFQQKCLQSDGGIYINLDTGHTGVIQAYELP